LTAFNERNGNNVFLKQAALRQYVNRIAKASEEMTVPKEGWIRTMRNALGMSGPQLAERLGLTRARVSQVELNEESGFVSITTMRTMAEAMGCRFVYAIVPEERTVEDVVKAQARKRARIALANQGLSKSVMKEEVDRLAEELLIRTPPDFWEDS
jgi:predicted DNA-binding mobile mystery protein A